MTADKTAKITSVALYARVSTSDKGQDPEVQLQPLRAMAASRGWKVEIEYVDHGFSGAKDRRPKLDQLMMDVIKGRRDFQAVLVWKFDRFARSSKHLLSALETFNENSVAFVSMTEGVDTSTPLGKLVFTILGAVAEMERALIIERIKAGLAKAGAGKPGRKIVGEPSRTTLWRRAVKRAALAEGFDMPIGRVIEQIKEDVEEGLQ